MTVKGMIAAETLTVAELLHRFIYVPQLNIEPRRRDEQAMNTKINANNNGKSHWLVFVVVVTNFVCLARRGWESSSGQS